MYSSNIRQKFIEFFQQRGHQHIPPAPIVNKNDPTLLFTNAGMNQFKDFFLNQQEAPYQRAVNSQPCLRVSGKHNDLEEVGVDTYHHTMFEMLGNWSFGEYFKEQAIQWAWELLTKVYGLPEEKLYVTVFGGDTTEKLAPDQESLAIWEKYVNRDKILYGNKKDNFWEMGDSGPCGPCSEIHVDIRQAEEIQKEPGKNLVNTGHPLVIEIWNLVFMEYNRLSGGQLVALPAKHVDTGMGFERLTMVLQDKTSTYDTDLFVPLIHNIMRLSHKIYGKNKEIDIAIRVIADHIRAVTFAIADGQIPSNTQAGYVIRRILRRAIRYGYTSLGLEKPFMYQLVSVLAQQFKNVYPQIKLQQTYIEQVIKSEEEAFFKTLATGLHRLEHISENLRISGTRVINGTTIFELYDTYGFPPDLTRLIAQEKGLQVDENGFEKALQDQRLRSQQAALVNQGEWEILLNDVEPIFVGYDQLEVVAKVVQYRSIQYKGQEVYQLVLDRTPFYPEGGGQVGDTGKLVINNQTIPVFDTKKEYDRIIHYTNELPKNLNDPVQAVVDAKRRNLIENNHTATHLLHAALRHVLGIHVEQKGSLVNEKLLRFDFSHYTKVTPEQIQQIEHIVNQKIRANIPLQETRNIPLETAKNMGVTALFGEKYGEHVRVITFDSHFSKELCGGTHAATTGGLGFFKITAESGIAAGTRRIEAMTADAAEDFVANQIVLVTQIAEALKKPKDLVKSIYQLLEDKAILEKKLHIYQKQEVQTIIEKLQQQIKKVQQVHVLIEQLKLSHEEALKQVALGFRDRPGSFFLTLATVIDHQPHIAILISEDLIKNYQLNANTIIKELASLIQGGGGGQPFFASAKGNNPSGIDQVLIKARLLLEKHMINPS
ncbi:MAG: alanine--tRNA ligase [Candidatus Amoebophilus sp. 36-38]|nr:MAG: alanine--tRNA ligase [Candidatus Amoebophilus sp. 36-38]